MPQLIEQGYLYIAQPPLFKVKKGKTEKYVQNETEMQNMLFELAAEDIAIPIKSQEVKGKALIPFLKRLLNYEKLLEWFKRRRKDPEMLKFLLEAGINKELMKDRDGLTALLERMNAAVPGLTIEELSVDEEHGAFSVEIRKQNYKIVLDVNLLVSPEFREL
jgi:DNA gyrase subunit B